MKAHDWLNQQFEDLKKLIDSDNYSDESARAFIQNFTTSFVSEVPLTGNNQSTFTYNEVVNEIVENSLVGIWVINAHGQTVYANKTAYKILGVDENRSDINAYHQYIFQPNSDSVSLQPVKDSKPLVLEIAFYNDKAQKKHLLMSESPLFSKNGEYNGCISLFSEITQRKEAEKALHEVSSRYRIISEMISDYVYAIKQDVNGKLICEWVSGNFKETTGYSFDEISKLPEGYVSLIASNFKQDFTRDIEKAHIHKSKRIYQIVNKNGDFRWIQDSVSIVLEDGELKLLGAALDITKKKEAEDSFKKERDFNALISDSIPVGIVVFDEGGKVTYANNQSETILRKPKGFILQQSGLTSSKWGLFSLEGRVIDKKDHPFYDIFTSPKEIKGARFSSFNRNDQTIYISVNASPIYQEDTFKGIVTTFEDITKEIIAEHEMMRAKKLAEESDKLKSTFLANISHEIRTPLNGIVGFSDMLQQTELTIDQKSRYVGIISKSSRQLIQIVNDIIDIAKLESNQYTLKEKELCVNSIIDDIQSYFENELSIFGKDITFSISKELSDNASTIIADGKKLEHIFIKLLSNSLKFTNKGSIDIGYKLVKNKLQFFVKDTGIGISKNKESVIFRNFRQADERMSRNYGGNGLGLSISKGIIELMGGEIWYESVENEGTTFYFTVPYTPTITTIENTSEPKSYNWSGKKILIVDDDLFNLEFLKEILRDTNATILEATDGHSAVETCLQNKDVCAIMMDIRLPDISGTKSTVLIKNFLKDVPVIAQTANALPEDRISCYEAGCCDFISKPYTKNSVQRIVAKHIL